MSEIQPQTIAESLIRRIENARYIKKLSDLFVRSLFKDIDKLEPIVPDLAWSMRGNIYALMNDQQAAILAYQKALEIRPISLHMYNLGFTYEIFSNAKVALKYYREALHNIEKGNISLLNTLADRFIQFFDYESFIFIKKELDKCNHIKRNDDLFLSLKSLFGDENKMLEFGLSISSFINNRISSRFIIGTSFDIIDGRLHNVYVTKCNDNDDLARLSECNSDLSDFMVEFSEQNGLNFDNFYIYCEAFE